MAAGVFNITGSIALCFAIPAIMLWLALKFSDRNERRGVSPREDER